MQNLRLLFSSRDHQQIERATAKLADAGMNYGVRTAEGTPYLELWIPKQANYHTASLLLASPVGVVQSFRTAPGRAAC